MRCTNDDFPPTFGGCYFICASHLRIAYTANDEYNQSWHIFNGCLSFILVPVTIPCTEMNQFKKLDKNFTRRNFMKWKNKCSPGWCVICCILSSAGQKWEMTSVQFVINAVFENVFEHWSPAWHLICLLGNAILSRNLICLFAISLWMTIFQDTN